MKVQIPDEPDAEYLQKTWREVFTIAEEAQRLIIQKTSHYEKREQWLIVGRITNILFSAFYNPAMAMGKKAVGKPDDRNPGEKNG